jgi:hypothetical protein
MGNDAPYKLEPPDGTKASDVIADRLVAGQYTAGVKPDSVRIERHFPTAYRLARYPDGTLVLQGKIDWWEGALTGHTWRTLPTVIDFVEEGQP